MSDGTTYTPEVVAELVTEARAFADNNNGLNWPGRVRELATALEAVAAERDRANAHAGARLRDLTDVVILTEKAVRLTDAQIADTRAFVALTIWANEDHPDSVSWKNSEVIALLQDLAGRLTPSASTTEQEQR